MPGDNIKRAIQRGTGELPGVNYEEITFEGYGPGGVALIAEVSPTTETARSAKSAMHSRRTAETWANRTRSASCFQRKA